MQISITLIIVIITTIISLTAMSNPRMLQDMIFYPPAVKRGQWYRFFSCGLIHADFGHLLFNMFALYIFGEGKINTAGGPVYLGVEFKFLDVFGEKGKWIYLGLYLLALGASILPTYAKQHDNYHYRSLGASGAVSAVVFASILFNPLMGMGLLFIPVYIAGFLFGILYLVISSILDRKGGDNINHSAHIFGAVFGIGFTVLVCHFWADYPVLDYFFQQVRAVSFRDLIQFG